MHYRLLIFMRKSVLIGKELMDNYSQGFTMTTDTNTENYRIIVIDDNPAIHEDVRKVLQPKNGEQSSKLDLLEATLLGKAETAEISVPTFEIDSAYQGEDGYKLVCNAV